MLALLIVLAVCVVVVVVVLFSIAPSPTKAARKHLDAQLASIRAQLAALEADDRGYVAHQEEMIRGQWLRDQLTSRAVDSMDVPGFGEAMFEALREAGIKRLQDVELLRTKKVPRVGEKRAAQLWSTYKEEVARLEAEARAMDRAELDGISGGKLAALVEKEAADERLRQQERESTRIRLAEIERRRAQL
jgi:hypothetical protein